MDIEDGERAAKKRILVHVLYALQHYELPGPHQPGLFRRMYCQKIIARTKISDVFYFSFSVEHLNQV